MSQQVLKNPLVYSHMYCIYKDNTDISVHLEKHVSLRV